MAEVGKPVRRQPETSLGVANWPSSEELPPEMKAKKEARAEPRN
jgi:hypothetical protein